MGNFWKKQYNIKKKIFHKWKICIVWKWFLAKIILISLKYLFWDSSKWRQIRVLQVSTEKCKLWKICGGMCDVYGEAYFSQKILKITFNIGFPLRAWIRWDSSWRRNTKIKNRFRVQCSVKKFMLKVIWYMKGPITIDFFIKGSTVNSISYCKPRT